jgi:hypothetical protein
MLHDRDRAGSPQMEALEPNRGRWSRIAAEQTPGRQLTTPQGPGTSSETCGRSRALLQQPTVAAFECALELGVGMPMKERGGGEKPTAAHYADASKNASILQLGLRANSYSHGRLTPRVKAVFPYVA